MTRLVEYNPHLIHTNHDLIVQLSEAELSIAQERKQKNKQELKQAEQRAENLRQELLSKINPSTLYLYLKSTEEADSDLFRTIWQKNLSEKLEKRWLTLFEPHIDLNVLPTGSFLIHFTFTLHKPYLSKDDNDFHIIDNPLVREKVFRWPMVRPSGWKGSLRHALWQLGYVEDDEQVCGIFGETRGDETGQAGRLYLYPTFFHESSLEIINPHDRERRVGKNPILLECVPIGSKGTFTLLYVPFDLIGEDEKKIRCQVADDLRLIAEGVRAMMTLYGFGAKTSSGFGLAADSLRDGSVHVVGLEATEETSAKVTAARSAPELPRYQSAPGELHPDFRSADGGLVSEAEYRRTIEGRGQKYAKKDKQLYDKAKNWWEREGKTLTEKAALKPEPSEQQKSVQPPIAVRTFTNWDELLAKATELAEMLLRGDA